MTPLGKAANNNLPPEPTDDDLDRIGVEIEIGMESDLAYHCLQALVGELCERFPNASPGQLDAIGNYLLKAMWLGQGVPHQKVLSHEHD